MPPKYVGRLFLSKENIDRLGDSQYFFATPLTAEQAQLRPVGLNSVGYGCGPLVCLGLRFKDTATTRPLPEGSLVEVFLEVASKQKVSAETLVCTENHFYEVEKCREHVHLEVPKS